MHQKTAKFCSRFAILGVAATFAVAGEACAGALEGSGGLSRSARGAPGDTPYAVLEQLGRVLVQVENEYVDAVDRERLVNGAIRGMVSELDPHSSYMPPDQFQAFQSETEGEFGGIGIEVETRNEQLIVLAPIDGSPAERAGIRSGDVIVSVDGRDPGAEPLDRLVKRLRGTPGSRVKLVIRRQKAPDLLTLDLVREVIHVPSVSSKLLVDRIAYVRIKQFQEHTHAELLDAAAKLRATGTPLNGVVLDLRGDPGGLVDQAADVADEFLDGGVIYTTRHRGQIVEEVRAHTGGAFASAPCVVLVNQYTASAAELVAGALQDRKRASVVGERTFGKGSVQAILALPGGAGMRLTVARYYTPSGHSIQADGVHPDVAVETGSADAISYREKDLEGHLAPELPQGGGGATSKPPARTITLGDAGVSAPAPGSDPRNVPDDPSKGSDAVLKVGWQMLHPPAGPTTKAP
jgi:carboxyl-terminal processing protease